MKFNNWSIVKTADAKGFAAKPYALDHNHLEVCVAIRDGTLFVSVHVDGVDLPIAQLEVPANDNEEY
jgi:hypothetical protein